MVALLLLIVLESFCLFLIQISKRTKSKKMKNLLPLQPTDLAAFFSALQQQKNGDIAKKDQKSSDTIYYLFGLLLFTACLIGAINVGQNIAIMNAIDINKDDNKKILSAINQWQLMSNQNISPPEKINQNVQQTNNLKS